MAKDFWQGLESAFYPQSHAIIGASADFQKYGGRYLHALLSFGYKGKVYPVNPRESQILGLQAYPGIEAVPGPVDFATISVPAPAVPDVVDACLDKGVKAVQILTSGFKELGEEGRKLEERIAGIAERGIRVIGPNCFGVYCPAGGMTILPGEDLPRESGPVGFFSQSGGHAIKFPRRASGVGLRFSKVVSYGNACDVNECDLLEYMSQDRETKVITAYVEGVKDGARFLRLLKETSRRKPVLIFKGGLTQGGARAVNSHTGSLGGQASVWNAVFRQTGAVPVNSLEEMVDTALAFVHLPAFTGRRVCAVGGGGAITVAAADSFERVGLSVPRFPPELEKRLTAIIPAVGASARNPVDVGNPFPMPSVLRGVLDILLDEERVDAVVIDEIEMAPASPSLRRPDSLLMNRGDLVRVPLEAKANTYKPLAIVLPVEAASASALEYEGDRRRACESYLQAGIPVFLTLDRAARALANVISYYERRASVSEV